MRCETPIPHSIMGQRHLHHLYLGSFIIEKVRRESVIEEREICWDSIFRDGLFLGNLFWLWLRVWSWNGLLLNNFLFQNRYNLLIEKELLWIKPLLNLLLLLDYWAQKNSRQPHLMMKNSGISLAFCSSIRDSYFTENTHDPIFAKLHWSSDDHSLIVQTMWTVQNSLTCHVIYAFKVSFVITHVDCHMLALNVLSQHMNRKK